MQIKKKAIIILAILVAALAVVSSIWLFGRRLSSAEVVSPSGGQITQVTPTSIQKLLTWNDSAGFTFQYQPGIKINKHDEDQENYAHLDLYLDGKDGAVKILAADSPYKTTAEWASQDKKVSQAGGGAEILLSYKPARKVIFTNGTVLVGIVDENILFTIELIPDKEGFWQRVFDQVVSSFTLVYPTTAPVAKESGGSSEIIEEEETVE